LKKSEKPITSDIKTRPKSKCQKRRKRDSANGEEPRRGKPVPTPRSITESWLITDSQSLLTLSENHRPMTRPDKPTSPPNEEDKWVRAHVTEVFNYEEDAEGIDLSDMDYPEYDWDVDDRPQNLVGSKSSSFENVMLSTSYIPTQIFEDEELQEEIRKVCIKWKYIFHTTVGTTPAEIPPMKLEVDEALWNVNSNKGPPREQTSAKQAEVCKQVVEKMLPVNVVVASQAEYYSQVHLVKKPIYVTHPVNDSEPQGKNPMAAVDKIEEGEPRGSNPMAAQPVMSNDDVKVIKIDGWRFTVDYRKLNLASKGLGWPLPNIPQMHRRLGDHKPKYYGKLDFTSGYHQAPLHEDSRKYTAFITFMGLFEWLRVPMGLKGAPSYFQCMLASVVLAGLMYIICELYIDDLIIHGRTKEEFVQRLDKVFERFSQKQIRVRPDKCVLGINEVENVGHNINEHGMIFLREKIDKVLQT